MAIARPAKGRAEVQISGWNNRCGFQAQAYYILQLFLKNKLTKPEEEDLCQMVGSFYDIQDLKPEELRKLFERFSSPYMQERILGEVIFDFISQPANNRDALEVGGRIIDHTNTMNQEGFRSLSEKFRYDVYIYARNPLRTFTENLSNFAVPINPRNVLKNRVLECYHTGNHYNVLASEEEARAHNYWDSVPLPENQLLPEGIQEIKARVKEELEKIQNKRAAAVVSPVRPLATTTTARVLPQVTKKNSANSYRETVLAILSAHPSADSLYKDNSGLEPISVDPARARQIEEDRKYAVSLQEEEYAAYQRDKAALRAP